MEPPRLAAALAALLTVAWLLLFPGRLTDGDSCLYAAMGSELAAGGSWAAPTWARDGARADFHENPPLVCWPIAALELAGLDDRRAPVVANALWLLLLAAAMWRLGGGWGGGGAIALGVLLLHLPVMKYAGRASLELPFAACAVAAVAWLRRPGRAAVAWAGLFGGGALLARGVFALLVPALWLLDARLGVRRPLRRAAVALGISLALAAAFDLAHRSATGHGFWLAFWREQLAPSLAGTAPHVNVEPTWRYYGERLLVYGSPWLPLALVAAARRWKRLRPDFLLGLAWLALVWLGAVVAARQGSRYLFAAWPALALMVAALGTGWWQRRGERARRRLAWAALALLPAIALGRPLFVERDGWWRAVEPLRERRAAGWQDGVAPVVYGPFAAHDDRAKQFLRHHLGVWAFVEPAEGAPPGSLLFRWREADGAAEGEPAGGAIRTPLFVLSPAGAGVEFDAEGPR